MARTSALVVVLWSLGGMASGATYSVGAGQTYPTLASLPGLAPGDVVEISPGTYHEVKRWTASGDANNPITIRGVGASRPVIDANGLDVTGSLPNPRAVFQIEGGNVVVENVELINARNGDNGAGVRVTGVAAINVTIRNCKMDHNDMGIMSDSNDNLLIDACEVTANGTPLYDGYSHNLYLGGGKTRIQYSYIHDSTNGQNVKSRGHYTELFYNFIGFSQDGEIGLVDDAAETGLANSNAALVGNIVVSKARLSGYNCCRFIWFGQDSGGPHTGTLYAFNNTFIAAETRINFLDANTAGGSIVASNNIFSGSSNLNASSFPLSGAKNWVLSGAVVPGGLSGTVMGTDPLFAAPASRDYHLQPLSPCIDGGTNALTYSDGSGSAQSGIPLNQYILDLQGAPRPSDGHLDIGAYEYGSGTADGGNPADAGAVPTPVDGGSVGGGAVTSGCGCQSGGPGLPALALLWGIVASPRRRRRDPP